MQATLGSDVVGTLIAPSVLPEFPVGARIEAPVTRDIQSYWRQAQYDAVEGKWTVVLDSPLAAGEFNLVWRDGGPEPPDFEVFIPLAITTGSSPVVSAGQPYPWEPTVEEVGALTPAYTRGGFDDDRESVNAEQGTFTDDTRPSRTAVEQLIRTAADEVAGRVSATIPADQYGLAKATTIYHVKSSIAGDKQASGTDDASGEYRGAIARYLSNLERLIENSKPHGGRLH